MVPDSLKCKLLAGTLIDVALRWYMNQPRFSIVSYQDMTKKLIHQFSASRHSKVSTTSLFNVWQEQNESLRSYLARYNDATIKVVNPNQELFVGAFQNGLRAGPFNESLAQKPTNSMEEIKSRAECYIKGEESNAEKKARDAKERHNSAADKRNCYPPPTRYRGTFKRQERMVYNMDDFTPLNTRPERIYKEVYQTKLILKPPEPRGNRMGHDLEAWCKYHRIWGYTTDNCWRLKRN